MATRAQFFIGNPEHVEAREWLGCVAFDGYPDGDLKALADATSEAEFRVAVQAVATARRDFCDPAKHGFPFPWSDDLFLTDCTYAFFDGRVMMTWFRTGWIGMTDYLAADEDRQEVYHREANKLPRGVPAPATWDRSAPDSIIVVSARSRGVDVT